MSSSVGARLKQRMIDTSWEPGGWRSRVAVLACWVTVALSAVPALMFVIQGWTRGFFFFGVTLLLCVAALVARQLPRVAAISCALLWVLVANVMLRDAAFAAPASVLSMVLFVCLLAVFFGIRGTLVGLVIAAVSMGAAGLHLFAASEIAEIRALDAHLWSVTPANYLRMSVVTVLIIATLAVAISFIIYRQEQFAELLRKESDDRLIAERAFLEAQRSEIVSNLTSGLAHNFGNALTVISTWAELLERKVDDPDYTQRGVKDVQRAARQAAQVAKQIMTLGKTSERDPGIFDLSEALDAHVSLLRTVMPTSVKLTSSVEPGLLILSDSSEFQQAIFNLLLNARDAIEAEGEVTVVARHDGDWVVLDVADTGTGIPEELHELIFEPFFTTKGDNGTGLGLATIRQTMRLAGGEIELDSEPGRGTTFRLKFPRVTEALARDQVVSIDPEDAKSSGRILVVDDEEMVRRVIASGLSEAGYEVVEAGDIAEGLSRIDDPAIDLLLTDAVMPGGELSDLLDAFVQKHPQKPIIICSGYLHEDVLPVDSHYRELPFLQKPMSLADLRARVHALMEGKSGPA